MGDSGSTNYLRFTARTPLDLSLVIPSAIGTDKVEYVEYSLDDGANWTRTDNSASDVTVTVPTLYAGEVVLFRGKATRYGDSSYVGSQFVLSGRADCAGNINSLLAPVDFDR